MTTAAAAEGFGDCDGFGFGFFDGLGLGVSDGLGLSVGSGPSEWVSVGTGVGDPLVPLGSDGTVPVAVGDVLAAPTCTPVPALVDVQPAVSAATATHSGRKLFFIANQSKSHEHARPWNDSAMSADTFAPEPVLAQIEASTGIRLELIGIAVDGASNGAAYVRWPDGRDGVLTCPPGQVELMRLTAEILELAKSAGLPVPRHEVVVPLADERTAVVQERLPGKPIGWVTVDTVDALIEMNDRFAHLLADRPDVRDVPLCLRREPKGDWRHELLHGYSAATRRILGRIHEIGAAMPDRVAGDDLLHVDYARGNVLVDERGRITGVIDWNLGVARGDRNFALVSLRSDLEWKALSPSGIDETHRAATDRLDRVLDERIDPTTLRAYWAYWTLMKLAGLIWEGAPRAVEVFLDLGLRRLL